MKQIFRKAIAFLLIFSTVLSVLPLNIILADMQSPVVDFEITDYSNVNANNYELQFRWKRPKSSGVSDPGAPTEGLVNGVHRADRYEILYRNASKNGSYKTMPDGVIENNTSETINHSIKTNLDPGSIYMFKIRPFHKHVDTVGNVELEALFDEERYPSKEILYLTDIGLSATGSDKELKVTWDNPTIDGEEIMTGYRIYYALGGGNIEGPIVNPYVDVQSNDPRLIRKANGKLEFTIVDNELSLGKLYAVKIEPLYNSSLLRTQRTIRYKNKEYDIIYSPREYRINDVYLKPELFVKETGSDYITLYWNNFKNRIQNIEKIEIYESNTEDFAKHERIGILFGDFTSRDVYTWPTERPKYKKYYKLLIYYKDSKGNLVTMESEVAEFDPDYKEFEPYRPDIIKITDNAQKPLELNVVWKAFLREPFNSEETNLVVENLKKYLDRTVYYDIWITDEVNNFENPLFDTYKAASISAEELDVNIFDDSEGKKVIGYQMPFKEYVSRDALGGFSKKNIEHNKVYYVKIVATRMPSGIDSRPAYASHYIMPIDEIDNQPIMISTPPLRIKQDENGEEMITSTDITIEWDKRWYEAYDSVTKTWYSKIGIDGFKNIVFTKEEIDKITDPKMILDLSNQKYMDDIIQAFGKDRIKEELLFKGVPIENIEKLAFRLQDLKNSSSEIHVIEYDKMIANGGYDSYLEKIIKEDGVWQAITPTQTEKHLEYTVSNLKNNTTYMIFFRPFFKDESGKKVAYYPNFVIGTTKEDGGPLDVTPSVPKLEGVSKTDTTVTVKWKYSESLGYELAITDAITKYHENAKKISWEDIKAKRKISEEKGVKYIYFTFDKLFPSTKYHIGIRAFGANESGNLYSEWSNPVEMETLAIIAPDPPSSLGIVSKSNLSTYNTEKKTTLEPKKDDYLIVEWKRVDGDAGAFTGNLPEDKTGKAVWLDNENILEYYLVQFRQLILNRDYYIRAKTRLTITLDKDGNTQKNYNYIVQLAKTDDFIDPIEITVPPLSSATTQEATTRVQDSHWTKTIKLYSDISDGEYDGDKKPEMYPLPIDDFDKTYDSKTDTLTYRLRSNKVDSEGNNDNSTDQRFISKLVKNRVYDYKVDLTKYNNIIPSTRVFEMPYSIFKTFSERKINLTLIADNFITTIPYGAFETSEVKALNGFGSNSAVRVTLTTNQKDLPKLDFTPQGLHEFYSSYPHSMKIQVETPPKMVNLSFLQKDLSIEMKADHRYSVMDYNTAIYYSDGNTKGFERMKAEYNSFTLSYSGKTNKVGSYALIAKRAPEIVNQDSSIDAAYGVTTKLSIKDMPAYDGSKLVSTTQINNFILGISQNKKEISINTTVPAKEQNTLAKANMMVTGVSTTRQEAISALVRLYEVKTGEKITNYGDESTSSFSDIAAVNAKYKTNILKADKLGFVEEVGLRPNDILTFGELFNILDIILADIDY